MILVCHVILQDHMVKGLCDFTGRSPQSLVAIGISHKRNNSGNLNSELLRKKIIVLSRFYIINSKKIKPKQVFSRSENFRKVLQLNILID